MKEESISLQPKRSNEKRKAEKREKHLEKKFKTRRPINFGRLALGLFLVLAGIYYLAQNTGFLPKGMQLDVSWWQLWPLLIVFAGLSLLSSKSRIIALISGLVTLLVLLAVGYLLLTRSDMLEKHSAKVQKTPFEINNTSDKAVKAEILIEANGTSLQLTDSDGPLAKGTLTSNVSDIQVNTSVREDIQFATISTKGNIDKFPTKYTNNLEILLSNKLPLELTIDTQASKSNLELQNFELTHFEAKVDASQLKVSFPNRSMTASLDTRTCDVILVLPRNAGVRIVASSELTRGNFDGLMEIVQDEIPQTVFETQNYQDAEKHIDIEIVSTLSKYQTLWSN